jgi:dipeptidyl aminopeptidase/acylaminoacyl peptidase
VSILAYSETNLGTYYVWDRDGGGLSEYSDRIPSLNAGMLSATEAISYDARDGLQIPGYLTLPKGKGRAGLATIVLPHGGPESRSSKQFWFIAQFLAARGYAVFQPNFRGSGGYGESFRAAGENEWGGKMQDDLTDGARWLVEEGIADPDRMCIVGWSYGGYAAAMGLIKTPKLFNCGVSINGVLNLPRLIQDDQKYSGGREWSKSVGLEGESSRAVSPHHQVEKIEAPLLIIQAKDDARVHWDQGREMAQQLERNDKEFEYLEIEYGGHSMMNVEARVRILQALDAFLAKHISQ